MAVDVYVALKQLIERLLGGDRQLAVDYAEDPYGTLAAQGITDGDLSQVDMYQLVQECATGSGAHQQLLQTYNGGTPAQYPVAQPPAYHAQQSAHDVVQHLNYVTYATYEGDEYVTQQLLNQQNFDYSTNIDNSFDNSVNVDGTVHGDIETTSVYAEAGGTALNAQDNVGSNVNAGDNVAQAFGDQENVVAGERNQTANLDINTSGGAATGGDGGNAASGNAQGGLAVGGFGTGGSADGGDGGDGRGGFAFGQGGDGGNAFLGQGGDGGFGASADGIGGDGGSGGFAGGFGGDASADATSGDASADGGSAVGGAGGAVGPISISFGSQDDSTTVEEDVVF